MKFRVFGIGTLGPLRASYHETPQKAFHQACALLTHGVTDVCITSPAGRQFSPAAFAREWPDPVGVIPAASTTQGQKDAAKRYRDKADECLQLAELATLRETRDSYVRLAHSYRVLAEEQEALHQTANVQRRSGA